MSDTRVLIDALETNIRRLMRQVDVLEQRLKAQQIQASMQEQQLKDREQKLSQMEADVLALKMANSLLGSTESKREMKLKINALIRDIDACIAQWTE
jgi:TolA-binding protein